MGHLSEEEKWVYLYLLIPVNSGHTPIFFPQRASGPQPPSYFFSRFPPPGVEKFSRKNTREKAGKRERRKKLAPSRVTPKWQGSYPISAMGKNALGVRVTLLAWQKPTRQKDFV